MKDIFEPRRRVLFVPLDLVAVDAKGVHHLRVSHQGFELALWKLLCDADKSMPHLIRRNIRDVIALAISRKALAVGALRVNLKEAPSFFVDL